MTSKKQRARKCVQWYHKQQKKTYRNWDRGLYHNLYEMPPSVTIAVAHSINPYVFPLMSRRQWKKRMH